MSLSEARQYLANTIAEWQNVRLADLQFWHRDEGRLVVLGLLALGAFLLVARSLLARQPGRHRLVVPAVFSALFTQALRWRLALGWGSGVGASAAGLLASFELDLPAGAAVVLSLGATLLVGIGATRLRRRDPTGTSPA